MFRKEVEFLKSKEQNTALAIANLVLSEKRDGEKLHQFIINFSQKTPYFCTVPEPTM
ncbi:hypothetical protein ACKFKG_05580 [Phormidesmis sp. 146-35]